MIRAAAVLTAALLALAPVQPAAARVQDGHVGHAGHHAEAPAPAPGRRFDTDAPLRQGMAAIREAAASPALDDPGLAAAIEAQLDFIIANCRLPEDADARLHLVIERLFEAGDQLSSGNGAAGRAAARDALADYGAVFDHPGRAAP